MKSKNNPPRYLDALLTRAFSKEDSKAHRDAVQYIEQANKKIESSNGKVSPHQK